MSAPRAGHVAVVEGLYVEDDAGAALVGTRCTTCGTHYWPTGPSCRNPDCDGTQVQESLLGRTGTLYSWTVQSYRPPPLHRRDDWAPFAIGLVDTPEGVRVLAALTGCTPDELSIGQPVRLVVLPLHVDDDGRSVATYAYAPAGGQEHA